MFRIIKEKIFPLSKDTKITLIIIASIIFVKSFIIDVSLVPTSSMEPTIMAGDFIFVTKPNYGYNGYSITPFGIGYTKKVFITNHAIKQGDIVIFRTHALKMALVKRVVGLPGQKVQIIDGVLFIDNYPAEKMKKKTIRHNNNEYTQYIESLKDKVEYTIWESNVINKEYEDLFFNTKPFFVPENHYFVLGDNRTNSQDSRFIGCISYNQIIAKAHYTVLSWKMIYQLDYWKRIFKNLYKINSN